jgi:hypothetical protein
VSKEQYNLKIEDFQDDDPNNDVVINHRDDRLLIVSN